MAFGQRHDLDPETITGTKEELATFSAGRHLGTVHLLQTFAWAHLPPHLQPISRRCGVTAVLMVGALTDGPELSAGLRKLREAKDCFVLQMVTDSNSFGRQEAPVSQPLASRVVGGIELTDPGCASNGYHNTSCACLRNSRSDQPVDNRIGPNFGRPIRDNPQA